MTGVEGAAPAFLARDPGELAARLARPPLFAGHEAPFWDDPHIARQMLLAHLDPERDAASRRHATIEREVTWIADRLGLGPGARVLDLGCGPGLYCERLARRGLRVTGVDLSAGSIAVARERAAAADLPIAYTVADYRSLDVGTDFDAALMIYLDFGVLDDVGRDALLANVHRALRPGGAFVFDLATPEHPFPGDGTTAWTLASEGGFWRPGPYLELTRHFTFPEARAHLRQTAILTPGGAVTIYRIWQRMDTPSTIRDVLSRAGFAVAEIHEDLAGTAYRDSSPTMGVIARRL